jgi:hypothetical protein
MMPETGHIIFKIKPFVPGTAKIPLQERETFKEFWYHYRNSFSVLFINQNEKNKFYERHR